MKVNKYQKKGKGDSYDLVNFLKRGETPSASSAREPLLQLCSFSADSGGAENYMD